MLYLQLRHVTEYRVFESVDNNTGINWAGYTMELGFGIGAGFVPSPPGDGLDFDAPLYDTPPISSAFSNVAKRGCSRIFEWNSRQWSGNLSISHRCP